MMDILDLRLVNRLLNFCAEYALVIYFFWPVAKRNGRQQYLGYLCLAAIATLYFQPYAVFDNALDYSADSFLNLGLRLVFYWAAVSGYLWFSKEKPAAVCMYLAAFYMPFYNTARSLSGLLSSLQLPVPIYELNYSLYRLILSLVVLALEFLAVFFVHRLLRLERISRVGKDRVGLALLVNFLVLYLKYSVTTLQAAERQVLRVGDAIFYPLCAMVSVLIFPIFFEALQAAQEKQRASELERLAQNYELQNVKRTMQVQSDIRRIHHDIKNHLLAIRDLGDEGAEVSAYVDALLGDMAGYETSVSTGLAMMDAFLSEKLQQAQKEQVQVSVCMDLSGLDFIAPIDLISIFGNALDNALEATRKLPDAERVIFLKSSQFANARILRFSNPYSGELKRENGQLVTSKADPNLHGIGLRSIAEAVSHYHGSVDTQINEKERQFDLTVLIPLPEK